MEVDFGKLPTMGWASMAPELLVTDIQVSTAFWCDQLGFAIAYKRPEQRFVYLQRPEGTQVMLCQRSGPWETGPLERPFGRGVMFQIYVGSLEPVQRAMVASGLPLYAGPREVWRRTGDRESGQREIFVQDPDGYLIMMAQRLGERALGEVQS
jgi:catechol 2,3-dioxygenase-like lactoylglutathione lyase family enzyme